MAQPTIRFSVIGLNHGHIYGQVNLLLRAGAEFVSFYAKEPELIAQFAPQYPQARQAGSIAEILEDESVQLLVSAAIPCERASLGIAAMQHGKDFMSDKPGFTTLEQLVDVRKVQAEPGASIRSVSASVLKIAPRSKPVNWCNPARLEKLSTRLDSARTRSDCPAVLSGFSNAIYPAEF